MSYNPSKIETKQEISDADAPGGEGNGKEEKPDVKLIDQLLQEIEKLKKENQELNRRLQEYNNREAAPSAGLQNLNLDEKQPSSGQHTQPILELSKLDLKEYIKKINKIGSLEKLLENSHHLHPINTPAGKATMRMAGEENCKKVNIPNDKKLCRYCWDPTRCDCKKKNIVFMAQCLECEKKYAPRKALARSGVFLNQFQGKGNGIYIGYTNRKDTAGSRFCELIQPARGQEPLIKHWKEVHPTLSEPNKEKLYKFLGIYQGIHLTEVREAMRKIFKASIVYKKEENNKPKDSASDNFEGLEDDVNKIRSLKKLPVRMSYPKKLQADIDSGKDEVDQRSEKFGSSISASPQEQTVEQPHVEIAEHRAYNTTKEMKGNLLFVLSQALFKKSTSTDFIMAYFKFACTCRVGTEEPKTVLGDDLPKFHQDVLQLIPRFDSELYTSVNRWGREHARLLRSIRSGLEFFKEDIVDKTSPADLKERFRNFMNEGDAPEELQLKLEDYAGNRAEWDTGTDPVDLRACEPSTHTWWSELERKDSIAKFET